MDVMHHSEKESSLTAADCLIILNGVRAARVHYI